MPAFEISRPRPSTIDGVAYDVLGITGDLIRFNWSSGAMAAEPAARWFLITARGVILHDVRLGIHLCPWSMLGPISIREHAVEDNEVGPLKVVA